MGWRDCGLGGLQNTPRLPSSPRSPPHLQAIEANPLLKLYCEERAKAAAEPRTVASSSRVVSRNDGPGLLGAAAPPKRGRSPAGASCSPQPLRGAALSEVAAARVAALNKSHEAILAAAATDLKGMELVKFIQTEMMAHDARLAKIT